jgi:hypothetical protein
MQHISTTLGTLRRTAIGELVRKPRLIDKLATHDSSLRQYRHRPFTPLNPQPIYQQHDSCNYRGQRQTN